MLNFIIRPRSAQQKRRKGFDTRFIAVVWFMLASVAHAGDLVVIVNPASEITQLSQDDLTRIFLIKTKTYPNEKPVVPFIPREDDPTRLQFEAAVLEKSPMQVKAYWTRLLFTGRGNPPANLDSADQIKKKVAESPSAIGYIDSTAVDKTVRVVYTIKQ